MDEKEKVGYGKPPEEGRFKPGKSGNPKGRPKGTKNTYTLLTKLLDQKLVVQENGKTVKISKRVAMFTQLINKGLKGDVKAITALLPHILIADMKAEECEHVISVLSQDDQEIINSYYSHYQIKEGKNDE